MILHSSDKNPVEASEATAVSITRIDNDPTQHHKYAVCTFGKICFFVNGF